MRIDKNDIIQEFYEVIVNSEFVNSDYVESPLKVDYLKAALSLIKELTEENERLRAESVVRLPCVAYNKKHERYQVIHKGKQGHIFASKLYFTKRDAEIAISKTKGE